MRLIISPRELQVRLQSALKNMAIAKTKRPAKPTVFLSHSSSNRRELLALKRVLDARAGGLIEFFLSSDDDSIPHGTIWPAEVRAALDRMQLMLIFVSAEALKSGWTYFEAGYGLHRLGTANIYCLPGTDKAALPSPFNVLQNRNLHAPREASLLIRQINELLGGRLLETVTKEEFDGIFKKPFLGQIESGPTFEELVESVAVGALGSSDSLEVFSRVCRAHALPVSSIPNDFLGTDGLCSTGVRMLVENPSTIEELEEFTVTEEIRRKGEARIFKLFGTWREPLHEMHGETHALAEIEAHNSEIQKKNESIRENNAATLAGPRNCRFILSPINISVSVSSIDYWLDGVGINEPIVVEISLVENVACERRIEAISAKIHGSPLLLREDGTLLWAERIVLKLCSRETRSLTLTATNANTKLSEFQLQDMISTLFRLNILSLPSQRGMKRKR